MIKIIAVMRPKPGVSAEEFKRYYEEQHAPLVSSFYPELKIYRRNYVEVVSRKPAGAVDDFPFLVFTEAYVEDEEAFRAFREKAAHPDVRSAIDTDEARFVDRDSIWILRVDERQTEA